MRDTIESLEAMVSRLEDKKHSLYSKAFETDKQIKAILLGIQGICPHEVFTVKHRSWEDTTYWREKVCNRCHKVIATSNYFAEYSNWENVK